MRSKDGFRRTTPLLHLEMFPFDLQFDVRAFVDSRPAHAIALNRFDKGAELVVTLRLDALVETARANLRAAAESTTTGRVIRLAKYEPVHVALMRIKERHHRKNDRYVPVNGRCNTPKLLIPSNACVMRRDRTADSPAT